MKILVINGSPNKDRSTTLKLSKTFLNGMEETAEIINTIDLKIAPCKACYACWIKTEGKCIQNDDAIGILEKIRVADIVIWSIPLYCYSAPSHCKALMDRTVCFNSAEIYVGKDGRTHHYGYEDGSKRTVLISSGGLPDVKGNFDGLVFQLKHMFGENTAVILCAEAGLFLSPETDALTYPYFEAVKKAGLEYKEKGFIVEETQKILDSLIVPREEYIANINHLFSMMKKQ
ncbi:MAG: flavodoxin family protein [Treponema sp.]|jgi:multimeric flavodoxin WrbA|nr:flavodoxin family protein [Treponema sp.]